MDLTKLHLHWRAYHYKDKYYKSYSLAQAYRENGKNKKKIVLKLGKLSPQQVDEWRQLLVSLKDPNCFFTTLNDLVVIRHYDYLDIAVVNAIWDSWNLEKVFPNHPNKRLSAGAIARILAINRCLDPTSKSKIPEWFQSTALPWVLDIIPEHMNASRIFRELDVIEAHKERLCQHVYELLKARQEETLHHVFYDLSSTTFSGTKCVLMKWGHCKEGYRQHIVLAMVVNKEGFPFYWEVLQGNTSDAKTLIWLVNNLKEKFKDITMTTLVFDRGMVSDDNLELLDRKNIKYISAMDRNQIERLCQLDFSRYQHLEPCHIQSQAQELAEFTQLDESTFYQEIEVNENRRYILIFNPTLFKEQRKHRAQSIDEFRQYVLQENKELNTAKKSRQQKATENRFLEQLKKKKLNHIVDVTLEPIELSMTNHQKKACKIHSFQAKITVDKNKLLQASQLDGFWLLVTNHTERKPNSQRFIVEASEAINPYREKTIIEATFRDIKSFIEIAPVHVWTENHVKAHYTICVLSHLINRTVSHYLHKQSGDKTSDVISHQRCYKLLADCKFDQIRVRNHGLEVLNLTKSSEEQSELLERMELTHLINEEIIKSANKSFYESGKM